MVQRVFMQIRREDLYAQIWREPMTRVAGRLEVSSNYLARVCEALNVPHPPRGYWARRSAGEKLEVPTLPPANPGDPVEWVRGEALPERTQFAAVPAPAVKNSAAVPVWLLQTPRRFREQLPQHSRQVSSPFA